MENLIEEMKVVLRPELDAEFYAKALVSTEMDNHFEVGKNDTFDGVHRTYKFSDFGIEI